MEEVPKLFAYAQVKIPGVPTGTPILAAILAYWDTGMSHSFNATKRYTKDTLVPTLGKAAPENLADLVTQVDNVIKYGMRHKAITAEHAAEAWKMLTMMYKAAVKEQLLLTNMMEAVRTWLDIASYDYLQVLKNLNFREIITQTAQETRIAAKALAVQERGQTVHTSGEHAGHLA